MPFPKRLIEPIYVTRGTLPEELRLPSELEGVTNGTLANTVRQLSSLSRHAEDLFGELARDAQQLYERSNSLQARIDRLAVKVTQLDSTVEEVSLQDIHMRKAFKSATVFDQQVFSRGTMPTAMLETYSSCDRPPPLDKLNCYRDDGKDGLKFYTDPNYFFELWRAEMLNDTERVMHDKGKNRGHRGGRSSADGAQGGPRHKKRVRAPQNTRERQKQIAREHGEYIMPQQNTIYRTPHQIPQQYQEVDGYIPNQDQRPPRPNSIEIRRSYQRDVEHIDGLHSPTLYQIYGQGPLSSESLYAGGTPTRSKSRPSQPPPAPPSNQGTPTSGTPTRGRIPSSGRDQLPPPPPPPEPTSPPPNGLPPHMLQHRMSESPHRSSTPELPLSPPPINHNQDLPPPPPAPTQQTLIQTKQASPPKQLAGGLNSSQVNQSAGVASPPAAPAAPPPPPPPPMPTTNIHAPPAGPMVNGDLIRALASPPKLTPVKDRVLGKLGPPLADPRNDLLKAIRDGIKLRKVEKNEQRQEVDRGVNGLHDVASILARRVAVEFSDSDSGSDSECDSEGWGENESSV
ncbi:wiskott-Aldrich syndrome protein family member 2 [Sitophilus oryzae]|uniref:Wiskott-Aldrich syndrome protein family member n=1 Tax=Sitophilus oryzae TaxID=7048 RepID=A0A6J2YLQ3_SITOR|nr:wiskott-Aldrich syndrome protein family member 2 [Sitophilus oryzae]